MEFLREKKKLKKIIIKILIFLKFIKRVNKEKEFLVVLSGFLDIRIKYGEFEEVFKLNKPNVGLYIPDMAEKSFMDFSPNFILLVLCADDLNK